MDRWPRPPIPSYVATRAVSPRATPSAALRGGIGPSPAGPHVALPARPASRVPNP